MLCVEQLVRARGTRQGQPSGSQDGSQQAPLPATLPAGPALRRLLQSADGAAVAPDVVPAVVERLAQTLRSAGPSTQLTTASSSSIKLPLGLMPEAALAQDTGSAHDDASPPIAPAKPASLQLHVEHEASPVAGSALLPRLSLPGSPVTGLHLSLRPSIQPATPPDLETGIMDVSFVQSPQAVRNTRLALAHQDEGAGSTGESASGPAAAVLITPPPLPLVPQADGPGWGDMESVPSSPIASEHLQKGLSGYSRLAKSSILATPPMESGRQGSLPLPPAAAAPVLTTDDATEVSEQAEAAGPAEAAEAARSATLPQAKDLPPTRSLPTLNLGDNMEIEAAAEDVTSKPTQPAMMDSQPPAAGDASGEKRTEPF